MRKSLLSLRRLAAAARFVIRHPLFVIALLALAVIARAEPFEIKDGDRVLFLGDTLLEREGTYGYLETRMVEQFPDRKFTVRNLAFSADTPLGWSRASFDPAAKGFERLKEQLALVKPTVVFLGYGMAASLQEMTDRSQDWTLNRDPARYGAEPMSAARFKKELAQCMDAIISTTENTESTEAKKDAPASPASPSVSSVPSVVKKSSIRFVLLSPIRHEDLRATRPGLPDPTEHNKLLEQYTKAIVELAKERQARCVSLEPPWVDGPPLSTENGIHPTQGAYGMIADNILGPALGWHAVKHTAREWNLVIRNHEALRAAIIRKNALFFHRWRPANETYLFGFRKREQGQNAVEIPKFDPLIEAAEAEIEKLKRAPKGAKATPALPGRLAGNERLPKSSENSPAIHRWVDDGKADKVPAGTTEPLFRPSGTLSSEGGPVPSAEALGYSQGAADSRQNATDSRQNAADSRQNATDSRQNATDSRQNAADSRQNAADSRQNAADSRQFAEKGRQNPADWRQNSENWRQFSAPKIQEKADFQPKTPILTSTGQLYAANDTPATGHQPPAAAPDLSRQTPAETPDLSKVPASPSTLPLPDFVLADGLEISLWAENPLLAKPTEVNWDAQGRLWVASSALYPMIAPGQVADDKILVIEDPGHTGKGSKSTVFADGLLVPTGVAPVLTPEGHWGCYVGQSTELLYFEDTKGTGKADKKRIVFSGFGTEDTHHIVHTLRWGPDGRLYFSQSVYIHTHMETPWGVVRVNSGGVFAYDPRTERVEVVEKGLWNTWGHAWDKWGQSFYTDGAGSTGLSWGFPGATFAPNEGARRTMASISPGSYPKFAGLEILYSPHFPADWQGTAVTNDFRAHKVVHFKINDLSAEGKSGYVTDQLPVLVQTSDATFRPIDVKLGPDGALYIADWSNPIINHGEVDFRDPRRDHEHGRIWRLSMKDGKKVEWESLVGKKTEELLEKLLSPSLWESGNARETIRQRTPLIPIFGALPPLESWHAPDGTIDREMSETVRYAKALAGSYPFSGEHSFDQGSKQNPQMRAAWISYYLPHILTWPPSLVKRDIEDDNALTRALGVPPEEVSVSSLNGYLFMRMQAQRATKDQSPRVRLMGMRALASFPTARSASFILDAAINAPKDDPQYEFAAWLSINDLAEVWTKAVLAGEWKPEGREKQLEFALNAIEPRLAGQVLSQFVSTGRAPLDGSGPWIELIGNTGGPGELRPLLDALLASTTGMMPLADPKPPFKTPGANARAAAALVAAARRGLKPAGGMPPWQFYLGAPTDALPDVLRLAGLWKQNYPAAMFDALDTRASAPVLDAAFEALRTLATPEAADFLTAYFVPAVEQKLGNASLHRVIAKSDNNWRIHALLALAPLRPGEAMKHLDAVLAETPEPQRVNVWRTLFAEGPFMGKFMQTIPANFSPAAAATALRAARELGRRGQPLVAKLSPLAGEKAATATAPADYNDLAERAKQNGDPVAGEAIYRRMASACTTCHAIGGAGGKLGPDLTSIGASAPPDYIIESVLDPAAKVKEGYHAFAFKMKDGSEAIGIPSRETAQEQFIRTLAGEQGLPKANIVSKKLAEGGASLMPAGLTAAWSDRERLNLYAFLMELGRPGPFDASKNNVARVWQLTDSGKVDGALKPEPSSAVTPLLPVYTLVDGRLTKDLLAEKLAMLLPKNATVHLATRFQAASAGKAKLNLTGIRKAWLDGQPLAIASEPSPTVELTAGAHTFTVEVDAKTPPDVLRLESPAASFLGE